MRMLNRTKALFASKIVLMCAVVGAGHASPPKRSHSGVHEQATNFTRVIRVRLFIDDSERQLGGAWTLEIKSGTVPVELKWVGKAAFFVGDISAASSCH